MQTQYVYVKTRSEFGKQCFFDDAGPIVEDNILPDPEVARQFVDRAYLDRGTQNSAQFALHEAQTTGSSMENRGMCHVEGGWPREVNSKDPEVTQRFRRRVEKDDNWAPVLRNLMSTMEHCVLQNNALNIHQHYFDDMIPTELVLSYKARKVNLYVDPQPVPRPINHLSWSPDRGTRLAVSYCFTEFEPSPADVSLTSYIWDIENPHSPVMGLTGTTSSLAIEFNSRDPWLLAGALMSGQVCYWDTRVADKPLQVSHQHQSHRQPANRVLWTSSKTGTEFFSSSSDGLLKWWDIRALGQGPTEQIVMDLEDPLRADPVHAIGLSAIQFEPTMGAKCMAGMENGVVVNVNRKGHNVLEKLATKFKCHHCPVINIDRNPFSTKHFITVGYYSIKIWADDVKESELASIMNLQTFLSGGCWSRSRVSVFFTTNREGRLDVYDLLSGLASPATSIRVCEDCLRTIEPHENGRLLATGSEKGNVYLVECLEGLTSATRTERALVSSYLERTGHFEKLIDNRLKELHMAMTGTWGFDLAELEPSAPEAMETQPKGKTDQRVRIQAQERSPQETARRKTRAWKSARSISVDLGLVDVEAKYFEIINAETEKYARAQAEFGDATTTRPAVATPRKRLRDPKTPAEREKPTTEPRKPRSPRTTRTARTAKAVAAPASDAPVRYRKPEPEFPAREEEPREPPAQRPEAARWREKILKKLCPAGTVCKPEVCCRDVEEALRLVKPRRKPRPRAKRLAQRHVSLGRHSRGQSAKDKYLEDLARTVAAIPEKSLAAKLRVLRESRESPAILVREEVARARTTIRRWKRDTGYGRYNLRKVLEEMAREEDAAGRREAREESEEKVEEEKRAETKGQEPESTPGEDRQDRLEGDETEETRPATSPPRERRTRKSRPCDVPIPRVPIEEIVRSAGFSLRDLSFGDEPEATEAPGRPALEKREHDYPRISDAHTHGPPDDLP